MTTPYYYSYFYPPDLAYLMPMMFQWMMIPYYYMIYMQIFRSMIEIWRKTFESAFQIVTPVTAKS